MRKVVLVLLGVCLGLSSGMAQKAVARKAMKLFEGRQAESYALFAVNRNAITDLAQYVEKASSLRLLPEQLASLKASENGLISIQLPEPMAIRLDLYQAEVFSRDAMIMTSDGVKSNPNPNHKFYRGMVHGKPNSLAIVSVFEDRIQILFADEKGNQRIQQTDGNTYVYFADEDILIPRSLECFTDEIEQINDVDNHHGSGNRSMTGNCVEVYLEVDYKSYQDNGSSVPNTEVWIAELWNEVITLYENENIPVSVSDALIYTEPDPYAGLNSTSAVLTAFRAHIDTLDYNGRLAHFLSTRSLGGGIAYVNVLCSNSYQVAVSASLSTNIIPFPTYSWSVEVVTHEMGHNMGSSHTHKCVWNGDNTQIDDCGNEWAFNNGNTPEGNACFDSDNPILPEDGTIMSYCHLIGGIGIDFNLGFGPQPGDLIRDKYENASCNTGTCTTPICSFLLNPQDGSTDVDVEQNLFWDSADGANGYRLTIGTTPTNGSIVDDVDLGLVTTYDPVNPFPYSTEIYVKIVPYNNLGDAIGCVNESFTTEDNVAPDCTTLVVPADGSTEVPADVVLTWEHSIGNQSGYKVSIGTTLNGTDILDQFDVGNVNTYDHPNNFPFGTTLYVLITPYWSEGDIDECLSQSFTIVAPASGDYCFNAFDLPCGEIMEGSTLGAEDEEGIPFCVAEIEAPGMWYTFVGNGQNTIIATCMDNSYDTQLNAYEGSCNELVCITGNDDFCYRRSVVSFPTTQGTTYYILVQGWGGEQGNYVINRTCYSGPFYCVSSGRDAFAEWIGNVAFAGHENESGSSSYSEYLETPIDVSRGGTYSLEITPEFAQGTRNEYYRVWIDFNHDGDFSDSGEQVFSTGPTNSSVSGDIDIPITAQKGITRMRVSMNHNGFPSSCGTFNFGEVEDYAIDIKCNLVTSTLDNNGNGTLRKVSECVDIGEDVLFDASLNGATLLVTSEQIWVEDNWRWIAAEGSDIEIKADGINRVLKIPIGTSMEIQNLQFVGGSAINGSAIDNLGTLILRDCSVRRAAGSDSNPLRNRGILNFYGNCDIGL
jgi:hypothetical protein